MCKMSAGGLQLEVPPQESMEDGGGSHHRAGGLADETPYRPLALAMAQVDAVRRVQLTAVDPRDVSIEAVRVQFIWLLY